MAKVKLEEQAFLQVDAEPSVEKKFQHFVLFVKYYKFMWQHSEHCHPSLPVTF
jgi:hypothetical protein